MTLLGMLYWEHIVEWHLFIVLKKEPIGVLMINMDMGRLIGRRRVGISIGCVDFDAEVSFVRAQSEEHPHARLFDAQGVRVGKLQSRGCAGEPTQQLRAFLFSSD
jgi:hypothetical protein